ncbi:carbohydrate ABC transporter membrane protein 1 (CUT1 family) [Mobilisporobacter senegalensis]|uniref:Carbohydrate ABC transporter membrane protein 1 (CUT1 family) n=1 Tax=Mobilisporobacter senegalensis TaxID=1329262 RepID=A0A3N1XMZ6_9FIRM|nr:sugar ABC transporter permease [Mobilisporobacter senegalensis]ROR27501.1 carbohydrate ABC transporter membrane protein 1 (CUT1 family) [Mobilisporobacter senegalensis]
MLYKKKLPLFIFLLPGFILMLVFLYEPFVENIINSFYDMTSFVKMPGKEWKFIGLDNFEKLLTDPKIKISLVNSFKMMGLTIVFQVGIAFILAILVNSIKRGQHIFRTVYFFPIVISATAIGLIFKLFYNYNGGMLNQLLKALDKEPINWLAPSIAFIMVSIPTLWSYVGFYFVIMLTGLSDISEDVFEAAAIDGCSKFKQVFYITIPLLRGVICTCITLAVTGALKVFDLPWVIVPKGAPQGVTHFLGTYMYEQTFTIGNIDYGSIIALLIVILGVVVSGIVSKILKPDANL